MVLRRRAPGGFTLVELLVVIALISLLMTVMVPVILRFMSGRGLAMAGNNLAGFVAYARTEAMNTRQIHVLVAYEEKTAIDTGGIYQVEAGPGLALFRINPDPQEGEAVITFVKQLNFEAQVGGDVHFAAKWLNAAPKGPILDLPEQANEKFEGRYKIGIRPDGRLMVPEDKPGYVLDTGKTKGIEADMVVTDDTRFMFVDFNPATGAVRRTSPVDAEETDMQ